MREYFGDGAAVYSLTNRKRYVLLPALQRRLPVAKLGERLLDLACGNGLLNDIFANKNYHYTGLDISADMIKQASASHPKSAFIQADARSFSSGTTESFNVVTAILLLPALETLEEVRLVMQETAAVLTSGGLALFAVGHPSYDAYMRSGLFNYPGVTTEWSGYYASGTKHLIEVEFPSGTFTFEDYHYTLADYLEAIQNAGLTLTVFDECPPEPSLQKTHPDLYKKYNETPGYLLLGAVKNKS